MLLLQFFYFNVTFKNNKLHNKCPYNISNQLNFKYFWTPHPKYLKVNMYEKEFKYVGTPGST